MTRHRVGALVGDDHLVGADGARGELGAVEHEMGELAQQQRVLRAQRLALAAVGDDDRAPARRGDRAHLAAPSGRRRRRGRAGPRARRRRAAPSARAPAARGRAVQLEVAVERCHRPVGAADEQARERDICADRAHWTGSTWSVPLAVPVAALISQRERERQRVPVGRGHARADLRPVERGDRAAEAGRARRGCRSRHALEVICTPPPATGLPSMRTSSVPQARVRDRERDVDLDEPAASPGAA